jgi:hypothetical protein
VPSQYDVGSLSRLVRDDKDVAAVDGGMIVAGLLIGCVFPCVCAIILLCGTAFIKEHQNSSLRHTGPRCGFLLFFLFVATIWASGASLYMHFKTMSDDAATACPSCRIIEAHAQCQKCTETIDSTTGYAKVLASDQITPSPPATTTTVVVPRVGDSTRVWTEYRYLLSVVYLTLGCSVDTAAPGDYRQGTVTTRDMGDPDHFFNSSDIVGYRILCLCSPSDAGWVSLQDDHSEYYHHMGIAMLSFIGAATLAALIVLAVAFADDVKQSFGGYSSIQ